jgi:hypothetical protein
VGIYEADLFIPIFTPEHFASGAFFVPKSKEKRGN